MTILVSLLHGGFSQTRLHGPGSLSGFMHGLFFLQAFPFLHLLGHREFSQLGITSIGLLITSHFGYPSSPHSTTVSPTPSQIGYPSPPHSFTGSVGFT